MESIITNDDRTAMAEVDYIIHHMNERYLNKIPQNVQDFIAILKKKNAKIYVDPHQPLEKQGLKEFTLYFLMILNLKYWCDDARRKDILLMLENNQKKYDDKVNNIFDNAESMQGDSNDSSSRPLNKPRQVIVTGTPTIPSKSENFETDEAPKVERVQAPIAEIAQQEKIVKEEKTSALDSLAKETDAMINAKTENFFTKFINKIKSFFVKK